MAAIHGLVEYYVVTGTVAATAAFNSAIASKTAEGFALVNAALVGSDGTSISQLMFRSTGASVFVLQYIVTVAPTVGAAGAGAFTIAGDVRSMFPVGYHFTVMNSTGNNGTYTVRSAPTFGSGNTVIPVVEAVASAVVDGLIVAYPG